MANSMANSKYTIRHRWEDRTLFEGEYATLRDAVIAAVEARAYLRDAYLSGADLSGADLSGANLRDANLSGADLSDANLSDADLSGANLSDANLRGADLSGANLRDAYLSGADLSDANLSDANLRGAYLSDADLSDADLSDANLSGIRDDLYTVLAAAPAEVPGLLAALREGRIDGTVYKGTCACLVGTIANLRHCNPNDLEGVLHPDSSRPAERWFLNIVPGNTPDNSPVAKITAEWIEAWLADTPTASEAK